MKTSDGLELAGLLTYPEEALDKQIALVLGHENNTNLHSWDQLIQDLTDLGFTVLAFDFRGYGESEGSQGFSTLAADVNAVIQYLQQEGYERIVCMGSSMGGTGCLEASLVNELSALVLISSPMNIQGSGVAKSDLAAIRIPKLVMVAENDMTGMNTPDFVEDILKMYEWSAEPKSLYLDQSFYHGTAILYASGGEAKSTLLQFLAGIADG